MRWATRAGVHIDRAACAWLIRRFIDPDAVFPCVPPQEVASDAERERAIPFDVPGAELGHVDGRCSFESRPPRYDLAGDPALVEMAMIVHGEPPRRPRSGPSTTSIRCPRGTPRASP